MSGPATDEGVHTLSNSTRPVKPSLAISGRWDRASCLRI